MTDNTEYAEEFSKSEKIKRVSLYLVLALMIMAASETWVFPFITWFANTAPCHTLFGYSGLWVLWHGLFVGIPLMCALMMSAILMPLGIKGLKHQQFPPKGVKVYKPTLIIRGSKAKLKSIILLCAPLLFVVLAVWGGFQAAAMPNQANESFDDSICEINENKLSHFF